MDQTEPGWARLCLLACQFGWSPAGTVLEEPEWTRSYLVGCGQWVTREDAEALADALGAALEQTSVMLIDGRGPARPSAQAQPGDWIGDCSGEALAVAEALRLLMTESGRAEIVRCQRFAAGGRFQIR